MNASTGRVVLGATCYVQAQAALSLAVRLAAQSDAELRGLLVEEEWIMAVARRPGARIFTPFGRRVRDVGLPRMAAALRGDAERFNRALAAAADAIALRWSFDRRAGQMADVLAEASAPGDFLVLGGNVAAPAPRRIVYLAGTLSDPALEATATRLAEALGLPLAALRPADASGFARLRAVEEIRLAGTEAVAEALARTRSNTILIANLANAPTGLLAATGARFTRVLSRSGKSAPRPEAQPRSG